MLPPEDPRIRLNKTAFVIYNHADIQKAKQFLTDFGFTVAEEKDDVIFYSGYGSEPICYISRLAKDGKSSFGGAAYVVESRDELIKATKVPGATNIQPLNAPGGGEIVTLTDPIGFHVHLVYNQQEKEPNSDGGKKLVINYEDEKPRKGKFHRFDLGPAQVHKWGHYGVTYPAGHYQTMFDWYSKHLALAPSDIVYKGSDPVTCFFHIDRGTDYTDHHAFFFKCAKPGEEPKVAHSAYEVHDFDIQQIGHNYLEAKGYELCWGVGRHVLGSQVFDYWFDCDKFIVEHYADGDLVNCETEVSHIQAAGKQTLAVWGPDVPEVF